MTPKAKPSLFSGLVAFVITTFVLVASYLLLAIVALYVHAAIKLGGIAMLALRAPLETYLVLLQAAVLPALLIVLPLMRRSLRLMAAIGLGVAIGLLVYATGAMFGLMPEYSVLLGLNVLAGNEIAMLPFVVPAGGFGGAAAWLLLARGRAPAVQDEAPKRNWRR